MNSARIFIIIVSGFLFTTCSSPNEVVMPYKNLGGYSGIRFFPVMTNESEFTFRVWISNSTSVDRVISISMDSGSYYSGILIEIGNRHKGDKKFNYLNEIVVEPLNGFESFRNRLDRLNIQKLVSQPCCIDVPYDSPFSTYVIEIKSKNIYNCFRFDTNYPTKNDKTSIYTDIEKLLFDEFDLKKYFKFEKK